MKKNIHLIAEIGIIHNGDINIAKKLIDNSKKSGFHSVKFQKRTIDKVYSKEQLDAQERAHGEKPLESKKRIRIWQKRI